MSVLVGGESGKAQIPSVATHRDGSRHERLAMPDIFDPEKRSQIMSRIRSTGTTPEALLYQIVRLSLGHRWRIQRNARDLPGQPDIVVPTLALAIFADGCFFHQCPEHGRIPETNKSYWEPKLAGNVRRDAENSEKLRQLGYSVWRYWEHDFRGKRLHATRKEIDHRLVQRVTDWKNAGRPRRR